MNFLDQLNLQTPTSVENQNYFYSFHGVRSILGITSLVQDVLLLLR